METISHWCQKQMRMKPEKVVVKIHSEEDDSLIESINIPSVRWPLNGQYELFYTGNCAEPPSDRREVIESIFNQQPYLRGHCYYNAEKLTERLVAAGFNARTYVGWLFCNEHEHPIHHAWTVLNDNTVLDLSDDFTLMCYGPNQEAFLSAKTMEERRLIYVSFAKWTNTLKNSQRCCPIGLPFRDLLYVGCPCSREEGIRIYNKLIDTFPQHPCAERVNQNNLSPTQELLKAAGLM